MMPDERAARRTALIFASSQAIVGSAAPITISLGGLAGVYLLDTDKSLATAPVTSFMVGTALGAVPAAMLLRRVGHRAGFITGCGISALGGFIATIALFEMSFWLFIAGLFVLGLGASFVQQFRFAAADAAPPAFKARAISFVLAGGVITAILGPQIVIFTSDLLAPVMFAGAFAATMGTALVSAVILSFLPPHRPVSHEEIASQTPARPLGEILRQPTFAVGLLCGVSTFALMSLVMTGAPLAMVGCGFTSEQATLGISWHVMAMFAPSFFTGRLIGYFGRERIVAAGLVMLVGCAIVALSGIELWQFWTALILLGLGWNFGFIGATAMIADCYRPSEKGKVQGVHDLVLFGTVAIASLASGQIYNAWGWEALNWLVFPVTLVCLLALGLLAGLMRRQARAA